MQKLSYIPGMKSFLEVQQVLRRSKFEVDTGLELNSPQGSSAATARAIITPNDDPSASRVIHKAKEIESRLVNQKS
ncbi:MAG: hypothetical protein ABJA71_05145 [Ginsengibacter sp.]